MKRPLALAIFFACNPAMAAVPSYQETAGFLQAHPPGAAWDFTYTHDRQYYAASARFTVSSLDLSGSHWTWEERTTDSTRNVDTGLADSEKESIELHSVSPAALREDVETTPQGDHWVIVFSCTSGPCITITLAKWERKYASGEVRKPDSYPTVRIGKSRWHFNTEDEARRAARALSHLIKLGGGKEPAF